MLRGIGRLRAGGGASAAAFTPASLFTGGVVGAWYDPSDLSSMWQDSAGTTPAAVGQPVGKILDKSGNAKHSTQATATARPILRQDANGKYFLEFDGVDDCLDVVIANPAGTPMSMFAAAMSLTAAGSTGAAVAADTTRKIYDQSGNWQYYNPAAVLAANARTAPQNFGVTVNAAQTVMTPYLNGVAGSTADPSDITWNPGGYSIGRDGIGYSTYGNHRVYSVIVANAAFTATDANNIATYMRGKY